MTKNVLKVRDLKVSDPRGRSLLEVPRLDVPAGGALVVTGPSGAGKSTLLFALSGLIPASSGSIRWGTTEISGASANESGRFRREHIGFVFQDHMLFEDLSASENAAIAACFGPKSERAKLRDRANETLKSFGITSGPRRATTFSGGERQRIAVARALAADPAIILADEPTASLDRETADCVTDDLLAASEQGRTVIVVSHDPILQERFARRITLLDGSLAAEAAA